MRKFFTVIARFIAGIFALFFVITTILAIVLSDLNEKIFDARLYKNALDEQNLYARLPEIVGMAITSDFLSNPCAENQLVCSIDGASPQLQACLTTALGANAYDAIGSGRRNPTSSELQRSQNCLDLYGSKETAKSQTDASGGGMPSIFQNLTAADFQAILTNILPPATLKTMVESTIDQIFAYLNGNTNTVAVPLGDLKERLLGPAGKDLIMQLLLAQQPCSDQNLEQLITGDSSNGMVLCRPPEDMVSIVSAVLPDLLKSIVPQIPDKAVIIKPSASGTVTSGAGPFGSDPISTISTIRLVMRLSPLVPFIFMLLVTIFAVRDLKSWMRWWGIPFVVSGAATLGLGILAVPGLNMVWNWIIVPRIPPFIPPDISGIGLEFLRSIIHGLSVWIIFPAILLIIFGLAGWIGASYVKVKSKQDASVIPVPLS